MSDEIDDAVLVESWRAGDAKAGGALVRRHFSAVFHFFASKVGDHADELAQRTFLACADALPSYRGEASFKAFLFGVARRQLLRHFEQAKKAAREDAPRPASLPSPSAVVARAERDRLVLAALRALPLDLQIVVELHYWELMPLADIAAVFEIPQGTVKTRLFRARQLLRDHITTTAPDPNTLRTSLADLEQWADSVRHRFGPRGDD